MVFVIAPQREVATYILQPVDWLIHFVVRSSWSFTNLFGECGLSFCPSSIRSCISVCSTDEVPIVLEHNAHFCVGTAATPREVSVLQYLLHTRSIFILSTSQNRHSSSKRLWLARQLCNHLRLPSYMFQANIQPMPSSRLPGLYRTLAIGSA